MKFRDEANSLSINRSRQFVNFPGTGRGVMILASTVGGKAETRHIARIMIAFIVLLAAGVLVAPCLIIGTVSIFEALTG